MKRLILTASILTLALSICFPAVSQPQAAAISHRHQASASTSKKKPTRIKTQFLRGEAALQRVKQLRRESKSVARAMRDLEKKGYRPAFEQALVILGDDLDTPNEPTTPAFLQASFTQETWVHNDEYEVIFIPYDDGDPNTWEGIVERYSYYTADDTRTIEEWIVDESTDPSVYTEIYYPQDGGDSMPVDPRRPTLEQQAVSKFQDNLKLVKAQMRSRRCMRDPSELCSVPQNLGPAIRCAAQGCGTAAVGCLRGGPTWAACFGLWCSGAVLACFFFS